MSWIIPQLIRYSTYNVDQAGTLLQGTNAAEQRNEEHDDTNDDDEGHR